MIKYSYQRELIKDCLLNRYDHPTADEVYTTVKEKCPNISLATVYRNLSLLADMGDILRINVGDGLVRFDGDTKPHYHFICSECGAVTDIYMDKLSIDETASENFDGEIFGHSAYFYGCCAKCKSKKDNK